MKVSLLFRLSAVFGVLVSLHLALATDEDLRRKARQRELQGEDASCMSAELLALVRAGQISEEEYALRQYHLDVTQDSIPIDLAQKQVMQRLERIGYRFLEDSDGTIQFYHPDIDRLFQDLQVNLVVTPLGRGGWLLRRFSSSEFQQFVGREEFWHRGIRLLRIEGAEEVSSDALQALAGSPHTSGLEELGLVSVEVGDTLAEMLSASPYLTEVKHLELIQCGVTADGARSIARSWKKLQHLELAHNEIGDDGVRFLSQADFITSLKILGLEHTGIGAPGLRALAGNNASLMFENLATLSIRGNAVGVASADLLKSSRFPRLEELDLSETGVADVHLNAFSEGAQALPFLKKLNLSLNEGVTERGVLALEQSPRLNRIEELNLSQCRLEFNAQSRGFLSRNVSGLKSLDVSGSQGSEFLLRNLKQSRRLTQLRRLILQNVKLPSEAIAALNVKKFSDLEELDLTEGGLQFRHIQRLAKLKTLRPKILRLNQNNLDSAALSILGGSAFLSRVEHLDISHNPIGDEGAKTLATIRSLRELIASSSGISNDGVRILIASPHLERLQYLNLAFNVGIDSEALQLFADSKNLGSLERLSIRYSPISAERIATTPHLHENLRRRFNAYLWMRD